MCRQHFTPQLAQLREPWSQILRQLLVNLLPQPLRHSRALAGRRNRNLQIAAAHHRPKKEIAVGNIVHAVARNAARQRFAINRRVHLWHVGRRNHNKVAVKVRRLKLPLHPLEFSLSRQSPEPLPAPRAQPRAASGRSSAATRSFPEPQSPRQPAGTVALRDSENRQQTHRFFSTLSCSFLFAFSSIGYSLLATGRFSHSATACGTGPVGKSRSTGSTLSPARCARNSSFVCRPNHARRSLIPAALSEILSQQPLNRLRHQRRRATVTHRACNRRRAGPPPRPRKNKTRPSACLRT